MKAKKMKFVIGGAIILLAMGWLAVSGFEESKTYYKTVDELMAMGSDAYGLRMKVAGDVVEGSIVRKEDAISFQIVQNDMTIPVKYIGTDPVPDTFVDGAQVVVEGKYTPGNVFEAKKMQAKCASKYESEYSTEHSGKETS